MERLIIVHWNKSTGPVPIIQYPPEGSYPSKELFLKIWAQHELDQDNSLIELETILGDKENKIISIIQEYESEIYFFVLIDEIKENMSEQISPDILAIIGKNLLELMNTNKITRAIAEAFNTIKNYSKFEGENLISFFQDKIKFTILKILRDGVITKNNLTDKLRTDYGFSTINIDLLLISFIRENLIVKNLIPGSKECYFLINDLTYARVPPKNLPDVELDEKTFKRFKKEFTNLYINYDFNQEIETKDIINYFADNDIYNLILKLREENLTVNDVLTVLNNNEELFDELLENKLIFESKGIVYLFSDIRFIKFTPYYILKILNARYISKEISLDQYLYHAKLLIKKLKKCNSFNDFSMI